MKPVEWLNQGLQVLPREQDDPWLWVRPEMVRCSSFWVIFILYLNIFYDNLKRAAEPKPRAEDFTFEELLESANQFLVDHDLIEVGGYELFYGPVRRRRWPHVESQPWPIGWPYR